MTEGRLPNYHPSIIISLYRRSVAVSYCCRKAGALKYELYCASYCQNQKYIYATYYSYNLFIFRIKSNQLISPQFQEISIHYSLQSSHTVDSYQSRITNHMNMNASCTQNSMSPPLIAEPFLVLVLLTQIFVVKKFQVFY
jgi:hypothetical protein